MSANRKPQRKHSPLHRGARAVHHHVAKTIVTIGDLISAAYNVTGSVDAATLLLSPLSPLSHLTNRRIIITG